MTDLSARFALPLLQSGQAQKEIFHNEALVRIDAALHPAVSTIATNDPPTAPVPGQSWIIGSAPIGAWAGHDGQLAIWTTGGWRFIAPVAGMLAWVADAATWAWHDGSDWNGGAIPTAGILVDGVRVIGARQPAIAAPAGGATIDGEARTVLSMILGALRNHGLIDT